MGISRRDAKKRKEILEDAIDRMYKRISKVRILKEMAKADPELMALLDEYNVDLEGKHCVVIGRSNIVGKPMAKLLLDANATVTIAHSRTKNLAEVTRGADILIAAVGRARMITADMVRPGAIVIDVGVNRDAETGKLCGDVATAEAQEVASFITPVPGCVGPMTITMLMKNTIPTSAIVTMRICPRSVRPVWRFSLLRLFHSYLYDSSVRLSFSSTISPRVIIFCPFCTIP